MTAPTRMGDQRVRVIQAVTACNGLQQCGCSGGQALAALPKPPDGTGPALGAAKPARAGPDRAARASASNSDEAHAAQAHMHEPGSATDQPRLMTLI
jgi:hypothetical protein